MTALVEVVLPWPASELMPNRSLGRHWGARQAAKTAAKFEAEQAAKRWRDVFPPAAQLAAVVTLEPPDNKRRDLDNLVAALKPSIDGVAAGLNVDDARFRRLVIERRNKAQGGRVTIAVHLLTE